MKMLKTQLMAAAAVAGLASATGAQAVVINYDAATIHGNGASSISSVLVQTLDCLGGDPLTKTVAGNTAEPLGLTTPAVKYIPAHNYVPVSPTTANPVYNCAVKSVQPNLLGQYVSTGSGAGKNNWKNFNSASITSNPFTNGTYKSDPAWTNIHFAFSDSPIASGDLTTYGTSANIAPHPTGAAIQIPLYVLPVAVAYKPIYGVKNVAGSPVNLSLHLKYPRADGTGGLRLKKSTYCGIFNGTITNWNDAAIKADNGGQSLMDANDDVTRWNTTGVPIKLVGRNENSGTTNIFTRHLTAACGVNYTAGGTDQLPAGVKSTALYDKTTGALTSGSETSGKFGLVDGSDGVSAVISQAISMPGTPGTVNLGGYLGYIGADWVAPATLSGSTLHSADLQQALTTAFKAPTATNATAAFKGILPPQSDSTGKYNPAVTTTGYDNHLRNNPLAWVQSATDTSTGSLANPNVGYPIVGTTNMLLYTCYASPANRMAVHALAALQFGKIAKDSTGANIPAKIVSNTAKDAGGLFTGILPRNGIAPLSGPWVTAIWETFFSKTVSGNNPSALNLWIQDRLPAKQNDFDGINLGTNKELLSNPGCTAGQGA